MIFTEVFEYCPVCGAAGTSSSADKWCWKCRSCGFSLYQNAASAVALIIEIDGKILMQRRAKDPAKGKLALPGGFVDCGERLEDAVVRECREETGCVPENVAFFCSFPNSYTYGGVEYRTCDVVFTAALPAVTVDAGGNPAGLAAQQDEVSGFVLVPPAAVAAAPIAFPSLREALRLYLAGRT